MVTLNKEELILSREETKNLLKETGGIKVKQTPSKYQYEQALETVKAYEKRQSQLQALRETLSIKLNAFENVSFKINKKKGEVIFAGLLKEKNKTKIGKSACDKNDKFEDVIGKLIAVKKALGEDIEDVVKLVEPKSTGGWITSSDLSNAITSAITTTSAIENHSHKFRRNY